MAHRDACFKLGLLNDDKEYVEAIKEASLTASGHGLGLLFCEILISNSMSMPAQVWNQCWKYLVEGILRKERELLNLKGNIFRTLKLMYIFN